MNITEAKAHRETLWKKLDEVIAKKKPLDIEEKAIRDEIKALQNSLAVEETQAYVRLLEAKVALGSSIGKDQAQLDVCREKLKLMNVALDVSNTVSRGMSR